MNGLPNMNTAFDRTAQTINRQSAFAFIFMRPKDGSPPVFILIKRRKDGKFGTPGGGFDGNEGDSEILDTIIRELREEVNLSDVDKNKVTVLGKNTFTKPDRPGTTYNTMHYGYELSETQFEHILSKWHEAKCAKEVRKVYTIPIVDPEPGTLINMLLSINEKTSLGLRNQIVEALKHYELLPDEQIQKIRDMNRTPAADSAALQPKRD